ncbi:hypothetical protein B0H19DRAFT_1277572 [Mycena capillaripes]|nr:hypothetical protein B0H19DRAFT_1277572 [Mycena capillaripes]
MVVIKDSAFCGSMHNGKEVKGIGSLRGIVSRYTVRLQCSQVPLVLTLSLLPEIGILRPFSSATSSPSPAIPYTPALPTTPSHSCSCCLRRPRARWAAVITVALCQFTGSSRVDVFAFVPCPLRQSPVPVATAQRLAYTAQLPVLCTLRCAVSLPHGSAFMHSPHVLSAAIFAREGVGGCLPEHCARSTVRGGFAAACPAPSARSCIRFVYRSARRSSAVLRWAAFPSVVPDYARLLPNRFPIRVEDFGIEIVPRLPPKMSFGLHPGGIEFRSLYQM